jgi:intein-encoded DNA endonuclease-like protein
MIFVKEEEIEYIIGVIRIRKSSTDNTSIKRQGQKYRQHIHQKTRSKVQTSHPPKDRVNSTDNTSTKRQGQMNRQHIHQKTGSKVQTTHPPKDKVKSTDNTSTKKQG